MSEFLAKIEAELQLDKAKKQLEEFIDSHKKITLDVEVGQDSAKKIKKSVEAALKSIKADGSAIGKQLADSFNITDKSVIKDLNKQINAMMSDLAKTWDGKSLDLLKADGFYDGLNKLTENVVNNANVIQSKMGIYDKFFDYFKNKKIYVSDDLKNAMGGDAYKQLLNDNIGKIVRDATKGISIDSIWEEMTDLFPEHFSKDVTNQVEQVTKAFDVLKLARADIDKIISAKDLGADQLLGISDSVYVEVLNSANELKNKLEQSLSAAAENAKTTIDLDVAINSDKIVTDIRSALQTASATVGDGVDIRLNLGEEDIIAKMRSAINRVSNGDEPLHLDVHIDKTQIQTELNTALKDLDLPVHFNVDEKQLETELKEAVSKITDIDVQVHVNTDNIQSEVREAVDALPTFNVDMLNRVNQAGREGNNIFSAFGGTVEEAFKTFSVAEVAERLVDKVTDSAREAVETIKELNDINVDLQLASGLEKSQVDALLEDYRDLGTSLGSLAQDTAKSSDLFLRSGKNIAEVEKLVTNSTVLAKIGEIDAEESSEVLLSVLNGFQMSVDEAERIVDILGKLDTETAASAGGLGTALSKSASIANTMGMSLEKTVAVLATIKDTTLDSDSSVGNALKSMLSRLNSIKAGKFVDSETGESLNDVESTLTKIGLSMRDVNGQFLDSETIIDNIASKWQILDGNSKKAISTVMDGIYQANRLTAMFDNYDKVLKLTESAYSSEGVAMDKFTESYLASLEAKTNALKNSLTELSTEVISDELYAGFLDGSKAVVNFTIQTKLAQTALVGLGTAGTSYAFANLMKLLRNTSVEITNLGGGISGLWKLMGQHPIMLVTTAVTALVGVVNLYRASQEKLIEQAHKATDIWNESRDSLEEYTQKYKELKKQLESGDLSETESLKIKEEILDIQCKINDTYSDRITNLDLINGSLDAQLEKLQAISKEEAQRNLNENRKVYQKAEKKMNETQYYDLGDLGRMKADGSYADEASQDIEQLVAQYEQLRINTDADTGKKFIQFIGKPEEADEVINSLCYLKT